MVDEVRSVSAIPPASSTPTGEIKLSDLKKTNKALYKFFRAQGIKKNAVITQENIQQAANAFAPLGLELCKTQAAQEQAENTSELDGNRTGKTVVKDKTDAGLDRTTTTDYFQGKKNSAEIESGQNKTFIKYNGNELPERIVESFKGDSDSFQTTDIVYGNGKAKTETITYEGKFVKDGVTKRTIEYNEQGEVISNKTNLDETAQTEATPPQKEAEAPKEQVTKPDKEPRQGKISLPSQWNNRIIAKNEQLQTELELDKVLDADNVLEKLAQKQGIDLSKVQADKLKADLIKYNPSVFNSDGKVHNSAVWSNLDFPENAGELYKEGVEPPAVKRNAQAGRSAQAGRDAQAGRGAQAGRSTQVRQSAPEQPETVDDTPNEPRDTNPPKKDATGTFYTINHGGGPKNGTLYDSSHKYTYDDQGRLDYVNDLKGNNMYYYEYDGTKMTRFVDFTVPGMVIWRDDKGNVIEYKRDNEDYYRFVNGVKQP
ncbi:hypothetical protein J6P92_08880, partial [bacterium]|nr:hypothetical protein [bacterium]